MASKNERIKELEDKVGHLENAIHAMSMDMGTLIKKVNELEKKDKEPQYFG